MTHPYLRSIGFSKPLYKEQVQELLRYVMSEADRIHTICKTDERTMVSYYKELTPCTGIAVYGEEDHDGKFHLEYYFPYFNSREISTREEVVLEQATMLDALEGIVDEARVGVSLIFFVTNMYECVAKTDKEKNEIKTSSLTLMGLANTGTILLPIMKTHKDKELSRKMTQNRLRMLTAARRGNESAIENLTLEEMDTYTVVSKKIKDSDVFTLVDTYFMPFGVECDHYDILGEIMAVKKLQNKMTDDTIYILKILCNDLTFDVCINEQDLQGEPEKGRRFKGKIWMQGKVNFDDDNE